MSIVKRVLKIGSLSAAAAACFGLAGSQIMHANCDLPSTSILFGLCKVSTPALLMTGVAGITGFISGVLIGLSQYQVDVDHSLDNY
ncbi:MAG: hypothetical protein CMH30_03205 [Micavibrio sp.]|nr:hypothetical protein [Micavibrio sp.]|tara:strand:- start:236 stop:493 length:258 start_codon:yes stop_codon:yes gene_type:complete